MRKSARLAEKQKAKLEKEAQKDPKENQLSDKISKIAIDNDTTDGAEKMRRFDRPKEKKAKPKKEVQMERRAKKNRSDNRISNIAAMDNGTMFEAFKFLNYYQLATSSHVSKRFWNLIRTHRHKLALLDVERIYMYSWVDIDHQNPAVIKMFDEELSTKEYNEWVVRNGYSKQIPFEGQMENYELRANVSQKPNHCHDIARTVLFARTELNNEHWPLFQHFTRLLMDPFIFIRTLTLKPHEDAYSFLVGAMNPDHNRLQCKQLVIRLDRNAHKFIVWIKDHVHCDYLQIYHVDLNGEELVGLFLTGALCTSSISICGYDSSKFIVGLVQKFMGLKNSDECQAVESIWGNSLVVKNLGIVDELKRNFAEFIADEEQTENTLGVGFINNNIEKKLTLTVDGTVRNRNEKHIAKKLLLLFETNRSGSVCQQDDLPTPCKKDDLPTP
ncbi:hypothetical protein Ddc_14794 [Ditylenchus destructor]|nr:hypothetical protein Ddc_14794 [Ditylenchus destructor]